jgi:hypothetical protein
VRLLPHERWLATAVAERQQIVRSARVIRVEQTYGSDGVTLLSAGLATFVPAELLCLIAIALVPVTGFAYVLIAVGVIAMALSSIGLLPGWRAAHRRGR